MRANTRTPQRSGKAPSDAAVLAATGKTWDEWFRILDEAGAASLSHKEIVALLSQSFGHVSGWWQQSITVEYEKARGLREKHQHADGYSASASKTMSVRADAVFEAWQDPSQRARWLEKEIVIRKATPPKSLRITWTDGTHVDVYVYPKGENKCQVSLEHSKLPDRDAAERQKLFWRKALDRLKATLEA